jgi:hypothetical protein
MLDYGKSPHNYVVKHLKKGSGPRAFTFISNAVLERENVGRHWAIESTLKECVDGLATKLVTTAVALYAYAEFEGDRVAFQIPETKFVRYLPTLWDQVKYKLQLAWKTADKVLRQCWGETCGLGETPWQLRPRWVDAEVEVSKDELVVNIQDALMSQIWLLESQGLEPRVVLASPYTYMKLIAARLPGDVTQYVMEGVPGEMTFMGLSVAKCEKLRSGAIVV